MVSQHPFPHPHTLPTHSHPLGQWEKVSAFSQLTQKNWLLVSAFGFGFWFCSFFICCFVWGVCIEAACRILPGSGRLWPFRIKVTGDRLEPVGISYCINLLLLLKLMCIIVEIVLNKGVTLERWSINEWADTDSFVIACRERGTKRKAFLKETTYPVPINSFINLKCQNHDLGNCSITIWLHML